MRNLLLLGCLLFVPAVFAGTCLPGTLADYVLLPDACNINQVQFGSFFLGPVANFATEIDPALVQVTPLSDPGAVGLLFTLNANANAGEVFESFIHFSATAGWLTSATISLGSPLVTLDGAVTAVMDVCADGDFLGVEPLGCTGSPGTAIAFAIDDPNSSLSSRLDFPVSSFFDVFVDITIDGGLAGSAFLDSAAVSIDTPEPGNLLLVTLSLASLGAIKLRRRRRQ